VHHSDKDVGHKYSSRVAFQLPLSQPRHLASTHVIIIIIIFYTLGIIIIIVIIIVVVVVVVSIIM